MVTLPVLHSVQLSALEGETVCKLYAQCLQVVTPGQVPVPTGSHPRGLWCSDSRLYCQLMGIFPVGAAEIGAAAPTEPANPAAPALYLRCSAQLQLVGLRLVQRPYE